MGKPQPTRASSTILENLAARRLRWTPLTRPGVDYVFVYVCVLSRETPPRSRAAVELVALLILNRLFHISRGKLLVELCLISRPNTGPRGRLPPVQGQVLHRLLPRRQVPARAVQTQQRALPPNAQHGMIGLDPYSLLLQGYRVTFFLSQSNSPCSRANAATNSSSRGLAFRSPSPENTCRAVFSN